MKYTIEDLRNGDCAVINDGTKEELQKVLNLAFPDDFSNNRKLFSAHLLMIITANKNITYTQREM